MSEENTGLDMGVLTTLELFDKKLEDIAAKDEAEWKEVFARSDKVLDAIGALGADEIPDYRLRHIDLDAWRKSGESESSRQKFLLEGRLIGQSYEDKQ